MWTKDEIQVNLEMSTGKNPILIDLVWGDIACGRTSFSFWWDLLSDLRQQKISPQSQLKQVAFGFIVSCLKIIMIHKTIMSRGNGIENKNQSNSNKIPKRIAWGLSLKVEKFHQYS